MNIAVAVTSLSFYFAFVAFRTISTDKRAKRLRPCFSKSATGGRHEGIEHLASFTKQCALFIILMALSFASLEAQEVVHAAVGTLVAKSTPEGSLTVRLSNGATQVYKQQSSSLTKVALDESLQSQIVPAADFQKIGDSVLLLYYGYGSGETAIGIEDLGRNAATPLHGTVSTFDKHQHVLQLRSDDVAPTAVSLDEHTIVDTQDGVISGLKFHPHKNEQVDVLAESAGTERAASFVSAH